MRTRIVCIYDISGLQGVRYKTSAKGDYTDYTFLRDALGNITGITDGASIICRYFYTAFGETSVRNPNGTLANFANDHIANANPFRWKSHYYDKEFGYYYIDGRYYDPTICGYISADNPENLLLNIANPGSLNRYAITTNNAVALMAAIYTICTVVPLFVDVTFERSPTWWERTIAWYNGNSKLIRYTLLAMAIIVVAVTAIFNPASIPALLSITVKAAMAGFIIGSIIGGISAAISGSNIWDGIVSGGVQGALDGAVTAIVMFGILTIVQGIAILIKPANVAKAASTACGQSATGTQNACNQCFAEGTLVLTDKGQKEIESIEVGDLVLAYNEETGESDWKPVVRLFRNEASRKTSVKIKAENGKINEIVSTPGHKYYLPNNKRNRNIDEPLEHASYERLSDKWVSAEDLKLGDSVLLSDGKYGIVGSVKTENCEKFTTYNFEVEDYHTYYVGEYGTLVHNFDCRGKAFSDAKKYLDIADDAVPNGFDTIRIENGVRGKPYNAKVYKFGDKWIRDDMGGHRFWNKRIKIYDGHQPSHFNVGIGSIEHGQINGIHFYYS